MLTHQMQRYLIAWNVFTIAISTLLALPKMYNIPTLTPTLIFWIHKLLYFFFVDIFHGVILPLNMMAPLDLGRPKVSDFYVRKPKIEPRRSPTEETEREFPSRRDGVKNGKSQRRQHGRFGEEQDGDEIMEIYDVQPSTSYQQHFQGVSSSNTTYSSTEVET